MLARLRALGAGTRAPRDAAAQRSGARRQRRRSRRRRRPPPLASTGPCSSCAPRSGSTCCSRRWPARPTSTRSAARATSSSSRIPALHPAAHGWDSNASTAADATRLVAALHDALPRRAPRPRRPPPAGRPVRLLEKTPKNALRVPFLRGVPRRAVRLPVPRPAREPQQHHRRLAVGPVRHLSATCRAGRPALVAAARARAGANSSARRWPRSPRRSGPRPPRRCLDDLERSRPTGGARRLRRLLADPQADRADLPRSRASTGRGAPARCRCRATR